MTAANVRNLCFGVLGAEMVLALAMLAGYQAWIEPGAPRHQKVALVEPVVQQQAPVPVPVPAAAPAPAPPVRKAAVPAPATAPAPVKKPVLPKGIAPVPVPSVVGGSTGGPAELIQKGIAALNSRDHGTALVLFRQARQLQPANPDLGYLMGMALESTGELGAAIDAFRSCNGGPYAQIAQTHVKMLLEKLRR